MEFKNAIIYGFKNYANFSGVVDRRTFWWWFLFEALVSIAVQIITSTISAISTAIADQSGSMVGMTIGGLIASVLGLIPLAIFIPSLALTIRRLRDVGMNPLLLLISIAPVVVLVIGAIAGGFIGASMGNGYSSIGTGFAGVFLGMLPGIFLALAWEVFLIVMLARPTKTRAQGNKYAIV